jgi:hypothetical protein
MASSPSKVHLCSDCFVRPGKERRAVQLALRNDSAIVGCRDVSKQRSKLRLTRVRNGGAVVLRLAYPAQTSSTAAMTRGRRPEREGQEMSRLTWKVP